MWNWRSRNAVNNFAFLFHIFLHQSSWLHILYFANISIWRSFANYILQIVWDFFPQSSWFLQPEISRYYMKISHSEYDPKWKIIENKGNLRQYNNIIQKEINMKIKIDNLTNWVWPVDLEYLELSGNLAVLEKNQGNVRNFTKILKIREKSENFDLME